MGYPKVIQEFTLTGGRKKMKKNKPFYKIWWFWVVLIAAGIIGLVTTGNEDKSDDPTASITALATPMVTAKPTTESSPSPATEPTSKATAEPTTAPPLHPQPNELSTPLKQRLLIKYLYLLMRCWLTLPILQVKLL